jgi:hypothetical protein
MMGRSENSSRYDGWKCVSGELPKRDNIRGMSCINAGAYMAEWMLSPTHGWCYHILGVPNRSEIEIHSANFCGDRFLQKKCELRGCIALGKDIGMLDGQTAVLSSKEAIREFHEKMNGETFQLIIHDVPGK